MFDIIKSLFENFTWEVSYEVLGQIFNRSKSWNQYHSGWVSISC